MSSKKLVVIVALISGSIFLGWMYSTSLIHPSESATISTSTKNQVDPTSLTISGSFLVGLPSIDQIQKVQMGSYGPYVPEDEKPILIPTDPKDQIIIQTLLSWLHESSVLGNTDVTVFPRHNLNFVFQLKDGTYVQIERAYTSVSTVTEDGCTVRYPTIPDQVFVRSTNHPDEIRLQSPRLGEWINRNWELDMKSIKQRT